MDDRVFAVVRSRSDDLDASVIASALGGGGHPQAASAIARGGLDETRALVVSALERAQQEPRRARDVMSTPPRSVSPEERVRDAMVLCQRHGQSGVFVVDDRRIVGAVSREDLDKAVGHGLAHAPVQGDHERAGRGRGRRRDALRAPGRSSRAPTTAESPCCRDDELVGVVARADLLRALEGIAHDHEETGESLANELAGLARLRALSDAVASLGERAGGVYLVGGTVRDILLGEESFDIDIAVDGDAIELARSLAATLGGRMTPHERFGTAVVLYGDDERVDVVTTRTEFYDAPGSAAHGRAGRAARRPLPSRLHDQRDGGLPAARRLRAARRPVRRPRRPRCRAAPGAAQPVVHRRSDTDLPRDPLRGAVRAAARGALGAPRTRLHRDGPRRRPLVGPAAGRAADPARGSGRGRRNPAPGRASGGPRDPSAPACGRGGRAALRACAGGSRRAGCRGPVLANRPGGARSRT